MRLTLRTLLAYLDDTLDPQDAEALKAKLAESGFATQLVQRIRSVMERRDLASPSPLAMGPVDEANVISEYLDSTLPTEQVAEIERACLDSDPQLAEAAACHQILTMVLGRPAEVSDELRQRVYDLPDRKVEEIAGASFSALAIPEEAPGFDSLSDGVPTHGVPTHGVPTQEVPPPPSEQPVRPVGVGDSGVSDAPTRLRQIEAGAMQGGGPAMAGAKSRSLDGTQIYGGSIRPSRIAPWLGSLALAALLLFALTRIFQPLLNPTSVAESDEATEVMDSMTQVPEVTNGDATADTDGKSEDDAASGSAASLKERGENATDAKSGDGENATLQTKVTDGDAVKSTVGETSEPETPKADSADSERASIGAPDEPSPSVPPPPVPAPPAPMPPAVVDGATDPSTPEPPPAEDVAQPSKQAIAKIVSDETLIAAMVGEQWVRLKKDMSVVADLDFVVAPSFRAVLATEEVEITLVGPSQARWNLSDTGQPVLSLITGRMLVSAIKPGVQLATDLGGETVELEFADIESVAGIDVAHLRDPGFDPLKPQNHIPLVQVMSIQGAVQLGVGGAEQPLNTGEQWTVRGADAPFVGVLDSTPTWVTTPDAGQRTLESAARDGLIELLKTKPSLEIGLRESTTFRRSEVAALAAQTLLALGRADVYFGGSGILSEPKQGAYWPDHYSMLLSTVDQSPGAAAQVQQSIIKMDSANAMPLFRLLTGYSNQQLENGGDTELLENLDSSSMAVRVLALENLHRITGTTLYFKAKEENAVRRAPLIKKWETRQRKGDIRWQEAAPMGP